jgi:hypothetical protein
VLSAHDGMNILSKARGKVFYTGTERRGAVSGKRAEDE